MEAHTVPLNVRIIINSRHDFSFSAPIFKILLRCPTASKTVCSCRTFVTRTRTTGTLTAITTSLVDLALLHPPKRFNTSVIINGDRQFNIPLNCNNPRTTFFTAHGTFTHGLPNHLINISGSDCNTPTLHLTLRAQRRRVHHSTTADGVYATRILLTVVTDVCTICRKPRKLGTVTDHVRRRARALTRTLARTKFALNDRPCFSALHIAVNSRRTTVLRHTTTRHVGLHIISDTALVITLSRTIASRSLRSLVAIFAKGPRSPLPATSSPLPAPRYHADPFLARPAFGHCRDRARVLQCLRHLRTGSLSLTATVVPLKSYAVGLGTATRVVPIA